MRPPDVPNTGFSGPPGRSVPTRVNLHLVGKAFMPSAFGRDKSLPYKGILTELRFFAKTLRRETPQGDTAVSAQNDVRTQFAPTTGKYNSLI